MSNAADPAGIVRRLAAGPADQDIYFFSLRRCTRVLRSSLRCFFFDMRLRRFLITEPMLCPSA